MLEPRPLLLVHGSGAASWEWVLWREALAGSPRRVHAVDLVPDPDGVAATSLDHYLGQVVRALDECGRATVVIGASLGGLLALAAVAEVPAAALVLVNPVPPAGTPGWPKRGLRFPEVVPWGVRRVAETVSGLPDAAPVLPRGLPERWRDESGAVMRAAFEGYAVLSPSIPSLVITGTLDEEVPTGVALAAARRLGADAMRLVGVSHLGALLGRRAHGAARLALAWAASVAGDASETWTETR